MVTHQAPLSMGFPGKSTGVGCHCLLCNDPADVGNLISGSSAFAKTSLNKREVGGGLHNPGERSRGWQAGELLLSLPSLAASVVLSQHHLSGFGIAQLEFHHLH